MSISIHNETYTIRQRYSNLLKYKDVWYYVNLKFHGRLYLPKHLNIGRLFEALRPLRGKAKDCFTPCAWKHLSRSGGPWFCSSPGIFFSENSRMPWKLDPNLNPLPSIRIIRTSIRTSITQMKIHDPFTNHEDPWTLSAMDSANWSSGCLTSSWGNVLNTTVGHLKMPPVVI